MGIKEMVQYKRTADMEELYLMLNNDSVAYNLWHDSAEKYALNFLIDPIVAPYEICCMLSDRGYLDDACLLESHVSEQDKMSDKLFVKNNAQFLLDYFFKCCREKDYKS